MAKKEKQSNIVVPQVIILSREGWPFVEWVSFLESLLDEEVKCFKKALPTPAGGKDSPISGHTSSSSSSNKSSSNKAAKRVRATSGIFADADTSHPWVEVECNKSYSCTVNWPLYLIRLRGFSGGNYIIVTDMSWSMEIDSQVGNDPASFIVYSNDPTSDLRDDVPPTNMATIVAQGDATFTPIPPSGNPCSDSIYNREAFQHSGGSYGYLHHVVLNVGESFSATFERDSNADDCTVVWGVPERFSVPSAGGQSLTKGSDIGRQKRRPTPK